MWLSTLRSESFLRFRLKPLLFGLSLLPFLFLLYGIYHSDLGADPAKYIVHKTGEWTLRFLLLTLAVSPLKKWLNWPQLIRLRRMLGLFSFFYATLHFTSYYALYLFFDLANVVEDVVERPYITVGFLAFLLLLPLTITSTQKWQRRLGRRWQRLHRLVYVIASLGVLHFVWLVKSDLNEPLIYIFLLSLLFGVRIYWSFDFTLKAARE